MFWLLTVANLLAGMEQRSAASTLLTFENTHTSNEQPLNYYGGLQWQNVMTMNTDWWVRDGDPINGYVNGATTPPTVAWVPADGFVNRATATITSMTPFAFLSARLTSAWDDNEKLQAIGYLDGQVVGSQTVTLNPFTPTLVNFNFTRVDTVRLSASDGTPDPAFPGLIAPPGVSSPPSPNFVIDDVTVDGPGVIPPSGPPVPSAVPEPSGFVVAGLLTAAWWLRRKRK
jgi:hypothetical protein